MNPHAPRPALSVLICTFGHDGIQRAAEAGYPVCEGVEYCISWQLPDGDCPVPEALIRPDIRIEKSATRGLSVNRNLSLRMARGHISLIADDDVRYVAQYFDNILRSFREWPDADILTFNYESADFPKPHPDFSFDLRHAPRGYYATSFEIAFRTDRVVPDLAFDEQFGIGARWPSGEEDLFLHTALRKGRRGRYIPLPIARHDGDTTSDRARLLPIFTETKGALHRRIHPLTWPLRMLSHLRTRDRRIPALTFIRSWLRGTLGLTPKP